jgi:hypothetical protein
MCGASRMGRSNAGGARRLACSEPSSRSTSASVLACFGSDLSGSGHVAGGRLFSSEDYLVDNQLTSVVTCAGVTTGHAAIGDSLAS